MAIRYRRRINLGGGLRLNLSRSGVSLSAKAGPITLNPKRRSVWVNLPGGFYYQHTIPKQATHARAASPADEERPWVATAVELVTTRKGVLWHDAPLPRRGHRCKTWTVGKTWDNQRVDYCACGAVRMNDTGPWLKRNSRRDQK